MKHNRGGYFIKEGVSSIFTHGFMSFASIAVIVACLFIMGSFALLSINLNSMIDKIGDKNKMLAYIDETLDEYDARALESSVRATENVADAYFVSREEVTQAWKEQYRENGLFDNMDSSIFRHRFVVDLEDQGRADETRDALRTIPGIVKVNAQLQISKTFVTVRRIIIFASLAVVALLFVISLFIMSNTIKLTTIERREEIAIMKMVGATNSFIRWPFVVEGMILGIFGSLIAFLIQWGVYKLVTDKLVFAAGLSFVEAIPFITMAIPLLIAFVAIGLIVGIGGSLVAIKNYLKV